MPFQTEEKYDVQMQCVMQKLFYQKTMMCECNALCRNGFIRQLWCANTMRYAETVLSNNYDVQMQCVMQKRFYQTTYPWAVCMSMRGNGRDWCRVVFYVGLCSWSRSRAPVIKLRIIIGDVQDIRRKSSLFWFANRSRHWQSVHPWERVLV